MSGGDCAEGKASLQGGCLPSPSKRNPSYFGPVLSLDWRQERGKGRGQARPLKFSVILTLPWGAWGWGQALSCCSSIGPAWGGRSFSSGSAFCVYLQGRC